MATSNFSFEHRCITIDNEDLEVGNYPEIEDSHNGMDRLTDYIDRFSYFDIVMTYGYYAGACIDYVEKSYIEDIDSFGIYAEDFKDKKELFEAISEQVDIKVSKCYSICRKATKEGCIELIDDYLKEREEKEINKILDNIKKEYGYTELSVYARFSNGETIYQEVK